MRLTARGFGDIAPGRKKGGLNFLYRAAINEAREASGIKRGVKPEEIFDFRLTHRVNDELQGWKP